MFFGKYLIDKENIDPSKIVEGMIAQVESTPLLLRVLYEKRKVEPSTLVNLLDESMKDSKALEVLLIEKSILTKSELDELLNEQSQKVNSLAQWLLSENVIDNQRLLKCIEDFRSHDIESEVLEDKKEESPSENTSDKPKLSAAAIESMKELGIYVEEEFSNEDESLSFNGLENENTQGVAEEEISLNDEESYSSVFNEKTREDLLSLVKELVSGLDKDSFTKIHEALYKVLGECKLNDSKIFTKLLEVWVQVVDKILADEIDYTEKNYSLILKNLKEAILLFGDISEASSEDGELSLLKDSEWKARYLKSIENGIKVCK